MMSFMGSIGTMKDSGPLQWGWKLDGKMLMPIVTYIDPVLDSMLKFIQCKCKASSNNPCGTNVFSCYKKELKCPAWGDCRGVTCNNSEHIIRMNLVENLDLDENEDIVE